MPPEPMAPGANTAMFTACLAWFDRYILSLCVPLFSSCQDTCFRSGPQLSATGYAHKLAGRARSLLIPYMAWNTIGLLLLALKKLPALAPAFPQYVNHSPSLHSADTDRLRGPGRQRLPLRLRAVVSQESDTDRDSVAISIMGLAK